MRAIGFEPIQGLSVATFNPAGGASRVLPVAPRPRGNWCEGDGTRTRKEFTPPGLPETTSVFLARRVCQFRHTLIGRSGNDLRPAKKTIAFKRLEF